jgi:3'-phosphoadenosine 5'-phosphosulfate sulfotransferase (PAPS reductase)/FAD synthetase
MAAPHSAYRIDGPALISFSAPIGVNGYRWPTVAEAIAYLGLGCSEAQFIAAFRIVGPALISFSGGRTSALMLWCVLVAHGGQLPPDVVVAFANTGKEREETLRFVHECGSRWGVHVHWLEWREDALGFTVVGPNSASRNGEPFDALIDKKQRLPNGQERWCTEFLKVRPLHGLMRLIGFGEPGDYLEAIGLRHDEGHRILKGFARAEEDNRRVCYPLGNAKVTKRQVQDFWFGAGLRYETSERPQGFDLELPSLWGNCDLCFAMGVAIREERVRQDPHVGPWWAAAEKRTGGTFSKRESVLELQRRAIMHKATPDLLDADEHADEHDAECGLWCGEAA